MQRKIIVLLCTLLARSPEAFRHTVHGEVKAETGAFKERGHETVESSSLAQKITTHNSTKGITLQDVLSALDNKEYRRRNARDEDQLNWGPGIKTTLKDGGNGVYHLSVALTAEPMPAPPKDTISRMKDAMSMTRKSDEGAPILQGHFSQYAGRLADPNSNGEELIVNPTTFGIAMVRTPAFFKNTALHPKRPALGTAVAELAEPLIFGFFNPDDSSLSKLRIAMSDWLDHGGAVLDYEEVVTQTPSMSQP